MVAMNSWATLTSSTIEDKLMSLSTICVGNFRSQSYDEVQQPSQGYCQAAGSHQRGQSQPVPEANHIDNASHLVICGTVPLNAIRDSQMATVTFPLLCS